MEHASLRVAPNSTYKIYDALFGLEEGVITPENSFIAWNGENYPFKAWNTDQRKNYNQLIKYPSQVTREDPKRCTGRQQG